MAPGTTARASSKAATGRLRLSPDDRRAQLIEVGLEMLATRALDDVSIEEIAQRAGVSRGLLFHYFPSKRDYHLAVAREASQRLLDRTEPDRALPPLERLVQSVEQFVEYVTETRATYLTFVAGVAGADPGLHAVFDATRQTNADRLVDALTELGVPDTPRLRVAARAWVAFVEEATVHALARGDLDRSALLDVIAATSFATIASAINDPDVVQAILVGAENSVGMPGGSNQAATLATYPYGV